MNFKGPEIKKKSAPIVPVPELIALPARGASWVLHYRYSYLLTKPVLGWLPNTTVSACTCGSHFALFSSLYTRKVKSDVSCICSGLANIPVAWDCVLKLELSLGVGSKKEINV